jgi:hypothetical protein
MAFQFGPFVWESSTTTGTSAFALAGPVTIKAPDGTDMLMRAFGDELATGDTTWYIARNRAVPTEWEEGLGTWSTGGTLARTTVTRSSNANSAVSFSAGTKDMMSGVPSAVSKILSTFTSKGQELVAATDAAAVRTAAGLGTAATQDGSAFATAAQGAEADAALPRSGGTVTGDLDLEDADLTITGGTLAVDVGTGNEDAYFVRLYGDDAGNPYLVGSWNIVSTTSLNANAATDPGRPHNTTFGFGYNISPTGNGVEVSGEPALANIVETSYNPGGTRFLEHHPISYRGTDGVEHRVMTMALPHDAVGQASQAQMALGITSLSFKDWNNNVKVGHNFSANTIDYFDVVLRKPANNAVFHQQLNAAGSGYKNLPWLGPDDRWRCELPAVFVGSTPTSGGSYNNSFFVLQATALPAGGILLNGTLPTVTGSATGIAVAGAVSANLVNYLWNQSAAAASNAIQEVLTGTSGGDPIFSAQISGGAAWSIGIDNSDSDNLKIDRALRSVGGSAGANTALTIDANLRATFGGAVQFKSLTVAGLPAASTAGVGAAVYASNGRKSGEGAGAGTGIPVWSDGTNWRTYYDNSIAAA